MKVKTLNLKEFTAFRELDIGFSPGLNVFIGANATGKSHVMKLVYSVLKTCEAVTKDRLEDRQLLTAQLKDKLARVFKPNDLQVRRLVRRHVGHKSAAVALSTADGTFEFTLTTRGNLKLKGDVISPTRPCIFIPSRETLAMYEGFIHAYQERELSFDETYYDLCVALSAKPLRGPKLQGAARLTASFKEILGGNVTLEGGRFHVYSPDGILEAHLLAEGFRKVAGLVHLINNGSLMKNGILFWDEPEANLNPRLITEIARVLRSLAHGGVQVFIATHDYLLSHELSLAVEYKTKPKVETRFFAFSRERPGLPVEVERGPTLAHLEHNPILEEFAAHYDREQALFVTDSRAARGGRR